MQIDYNGLQQAGDGSIFGKFKHSSSFFVHTIAVIYNVISFYSLFIVMY